MQVILRTDFESLGKVGDLVQVKPGYARNFLIPRGIAFAATKSNLARLDQERKILQMRDLKERRKAGDVYAQINGLRLLKGVQVGEEDRMFGAVTTADIAELIKERGIEIDRRKIQLEDPIKHLGEFNIPVKLHREVIATITVDVVPNT
ncbi:MAG: 50S ribosomal protein L9 [Calditrichaeota bacterium]|nr:50S ribosomal protein L9 [Calditrichota bacterium]MCB9366848.1 50S ribosomal protein L9 [Calditrichota bacterium]